MLALLFHTHHSMYQEDIPFWNSIVDQCSGDILELGCGTGRILLSLAQTDRKFFGIDIDHGMLSLFKDFIPYQLKPKINLVQADLSRFNFNYSFGLIFLACNIYSTLSTSTRQKMLKCVSEHIERESILVVSMPNPHIYTQLPIRGESEVEDIFPHPSDGHPVQVSSSWECTDNQFIVNWNYDHLNPDGQIRRIYTQVKHNLLTAEYYLDELSRAGFSSLLYFGDFDRTAFTYRSPYLIIIASQS